MVYFDLSCWQLSFSPRYIVISCLSHIWTTKHFKYPNTTSISCIFYYENLPKFGYLIHTNERQLSFADRTMGWCSVKLLHQLNKPSVLLQFWDVNLVRCEFTLTPNNLLAPSGTFFFFHTKWPAVRWYSDDGFVNMFLSNPGVEPFDVWRTIPSNALRWPRDNRQLARFHKRIAI